MENSATVGAGAMLSDINLRVKSLGASIMSARGSQSLGKATSEDALREARAILERHEPTGTYMLKASHADGWGSLEALAEAISAWIGEEII